MLNKCCKVETKLERIQMHLFLPSDWAVDGKRMVSWAHTMLLFLFEEGSKVLFITAFPRRAGQVICCPPTVAVSRKELQNCSTVKVHLSADLFLFICHGRDMWKHCGLMRLIKNMLMNKEN